jgi:hypothetical protein
MNAILFFPDEKDSSSPWNPGTDTCMLPVVDRPILQHVLESLADYGVQKLHAILPCFDRQREKFLAGSASCGMKVFRWYGDKPTEEMLFEDPHGANSSENRFVVAWADCLPKLSQLPFGDFSYMVSLCRSPQPRNWLFLSATDAVHFIRNQAINYEKTFATTTYLDSSSPARLLESQALLLTKEFPLTRSLAKEIQPGIWLGRNTHVYPTAILIPPVYVGTSACIERNVVLGPNAVISRQSVIGQDTVVQNSIVGCYTAVGEFSVLNHSVLLGSVLHCGNNDTFIEISDPSIAAEI